MKTLKLNVLLGKTDHLAAYYKNMVKDYAKFFSNKQGAFLGEKKTYQPKDDAVDDASLRGTTLIQTTVDEKLDWFKDNSAEYINALFSQEKTNSSGVAKAELIVDGESWGEYTSLELLRLKNVIDSKELTEMISQIPVRSDSEIWDEAVAEEYKNRRVFAMPIVEGTKKTTVKENYILPDPNLAKLKDASSYQPQVAVKTETVDLGEFTHQKFSGQWSQRQKANALKRKTQLSTAIVEALKQCNECEVQQSDLTSDKIFGFVFGGK